MVGYFYGELVFLFWLGEVVDEVGYGLCVTAFVEVGVWGWGEGEVCFFVVDFYGVDGEV